MDYYGDEFQVPDFDPLERTSLADYLELLVAAFSPHETIARRYINANRVAINMINVDGYTVAQMYAAVDEAREICGLEKIERKGE